MQSTFQESTSGQAVIRNTTAVGSEQLIVTLHPGSDSSVEIQIREDTPGADMVSSAMSVSRQNLERLVQWLREQGAVD